MKYKVISFDIQLFIHSTIICICNKKLELYSILSTWFQSYLQNWTFKPYISRSIKRIMDQIIKLKLIYQVTRIEEIRYLCRIVKGFRRVGIES